MPHLTLQQRELAAIGASLASNCIPCIKYHVGKSRDAGLTDEEIAEAIEVAETVRQVPAGRVREAARAALGHQAQRSHTDVEAKPHCGGPGNISESSNAVQSDCCGREPST